MKPVRILVVDDHTLFRARLIDLLSEFPELQVVGESGYGEAAVRMAANLKPDIILLDVNTPKIGGIKAVRTLKQRKSCRILMLTHSKNDAGLFNAVSAGADGYLLKDATPLELRRAILQVSEGLSVTLPQNTSQAIPSTRQEMIRRVDYNLSLREMDVLVCLAQGQTTLQIADSLFISENTVKTHVRHILEKLDAPNRTEAVSKAVKLGLFGPENKKT